MSRARISAIVLALSLGSGAVLPRNASPAGGFLMGFTDSRYETPDSLAEWLRDTMSARAGMVLLPVFWAGIAPQAPSLASDPSDPANPAYRWGTLDNAVRAI